MRTITAAEIEKRGLQAVDEQLCSGPVHVLADDQPAYVIMTEAHYAELVDAWHEAQQLGIKEALEDVAEGRVRRVTAQQLIDEYGLES